MWKVDSWFSLVVSTTKAQEEKTCAADDLSELDALLVLFREQRGGNCGDERSHHKFHSVGSVHQLSYKNTPSSFPQHRFSLSQPLTFAPPHFLLLLKTVLFAFTESTTKTHLQNLAPYTLINYKK